MHYLCLAFSFCVCICLIALKIVAYFDGTKFGFSMLAIFVLGFILSGCILPTLMLLVYNTERIIRKKLSAYWLLLWLMPVVFYGTGKLPIPDFMDGMEDAIAAYPSADPFLAFAKDARTNSTYRSNYYPLRVFQVEELVARHTVVVNMGTQPIDHVLIYRNFVEVAYRNGHAGSMCGIRIVDARDPVQPVPEKPMRYQEVREVMPRLWVFGFDY